MGWSRALASASIDLWAFVCVCPPRYKTVSLGKRGADGSSFASTPVGPPELLGVVDHGWATRSVQRQQAKSRSRMMAGANSGSGGGGAATNLAASQGSQVAATPAAVATLQISPEQLRRGMRLMSLRRSPASMMRARVRSRFPLHCCRQSVSVRQVTQICVCTFLCRQAPKGRNGAADRLMRCMPTVSLTCVLMTACCNAASSAQG